MKNESVEPIKIYVLYATGETYTELYNAYTSFAKAEEARREILKSLFNIEITGISPTFPIFEILILERDLI